MGGRRVPYASRTLNVESTPTLTAVVRLTRYLPSSMLITSPGLAELSALCSAGGVRGRGWGDVNAALSFWALLQSGDKAGTW